MHRLIAGGNAHVCFSAIGSGGICRGGILHRAAHGVRDRLRAALRVRRQYFPGLLITFVEIGSGQGQNIAKYMAARQDITYLE